jgi:SAM-dependent methyltransferase
VAARVQEFYDHYPYPPPVDNLEIYARLWQDPSRRRADHYLFWPGRPYQEDRAILIAGCGTSQAAKHALRWPEARVTGIDFSTKSVSHTRALKLKYHLDNLQVYQLPLEQVRDLETGFDQIVCTGVLHHLEDPAAGLDALRSVLKPDGTMHLMVYAPYGRAGIYLLQEYCRRIGVQPSAQEIQDLVEALHALPQSHPLVHLLREAPDFQNEAALADALLHPQDRAYSVPQLFDLVRGAGLSFGRWLRQAPYLPQCGAIAGTPHASRLADLPAEAQYAALELFRGTMVRHSLIVYRSDRPEPNGSVRFDDGTWHSFVPIRLPRTICVEERLPPGAAAVLINQSHTYTDLYLPIDGEEKVLFDAVDGKRTITEIVRTTGTGEHRWEQARSLFERLWWYDQVVFDASGPGALGHKAQHGRG